PEIAQRPGTAPSIWAMIRLPPVATCAALVAVAAGTMAMLEPVLPLFFNKRLGFSPGQIGMLFGGAAVASAAAPFVYGPMTDRWGGRRLTPIGLFAMAAWLPMLATAQGFPGALALIVIQWAAFSMFITPSLAYVAEVTAV